jgi:hypothetical protein
MAFQPISEIRQFNVDARRALDDLHSQRGASVTPAEAFYLHTGGKRDGGGRPALPAQTPDHMSADGRSAGRAALKRHLVLAEEHVAKSEKLVARQGEIVDRLQRDGHALAANAGALLRQFEELWAAHIDGRDRLIQELRE